MANRAKGSGKRTGTRGAKTKAPAKKTRAKQAVKKPYARDHHRHEPRGKTGSSRAKPTRETADTKEGGVDEDLDYGAATRGHRWSRAPLVYVGGMPDRRQSFGRRTGDKAPPESFTLQSEGDQRRR